MELLSGATLLDGRRVDVGVEGEFITSVSAAGSVRPGAGATVTDLDGFVLLPAPAEPHAHLDKALSADRAVNPTGDLMGAIAAWAQHRGTLSVDDYLDRARAAVRLAVGNGATALRTHVDVGTGVGVRGIEALVRLREELRHLIDLQVVAFAGFPLTGPEGAENRRVLDTALGFGVDLVGGCPALDPDPAGLIAHCLTVADSAGLPVDFHVDETVDPEVATLEVLARQVLDTGFSHGVVASHCVSLGMQCTATQQRVAALVAAAGIGVVTLPQTNLLLQGRGVSTATPRGLTAVGALGRAGVVVAGGGDNLQDPFNVLGRGDPLETAALLVAAAHLSPHEAYVAVSGAARHVMGLSPVEVAPGAPAELLAVKAPNVRCAVAGAPGTRRVWHRGALVATADHVVSVDERSPTSRR